MTSNKQLSEKIVNWFFAICAGVSTSVAISTFKNIEELRIVTRLNTNDLARNADSIHTINKKLDKIQDKQQLLREDIIKLRSWCEKWIKEHTRKHP